MDSLLKPEGRILIQVQPKLDHLSSFGDELFNARKDIWYNSSMILL